VKKQTQLYWLILLILSQSCVVFQKVPVPLSEADDRGKVLIIDNQNKKTRSKNIDRVNGKYYTSFKNREKDIDGQYHWFEGMKQLEDDKVQVFLKDKKKSTGNTILLLLVVVPSVLIGGFYLFALSISG
jgi:hypothetical protein